MPERGAHQAFEQSRGQHQRLAVGPRKVRFAFGWTRTRLIDANAFSLQVVQRWTSAENQKPVPNSAISRGSRNPDDPVAGRMGSLYPVGSRRVLSKGTFF